jgi:hypothetical protein
MKYILNESQVKKLDELYIMDGVLDADVMSRFFYHTRIKIGQEKLVKLIKKYFKTQVGLEGVKKKVFKNLSDKLDYTDEISDLKRIEDFPKEFWNVDVISNLAYFIASNVFKLKKGVELEYMTYDGKSQYFFFDPELEELVGRVSLDTHSSRNLPFSTKNSASIAFSALETMSKSQGYGKNMYLTLLQIYDIIFSDTSLYKESLNIWVNVLPKYAKSYGYVDSTYEPIHFASGQKLNFKNVERFFASKRDLYF